MNLSDFRAFLLLSQGHEISIIQLIMPRESFRLYVKSYKHQALFYRSAYSVSLDSLFIVLLNQFCVKSECTK